jgi:hypothetical protein
MAGTTSIKSIKTSNTINPILSFITVLAFKKMGAGTIITTLLHPKNT